MSGDWIKIHRKLRSSAVFQDPLLLKIWLALLLQANWKDKQLLNGVTLKAGQLMIGQEKFAKQMKITRDKLRNRLEKLEKLGNITTKSHRLGTVISITQWQTYQSDKTTQPPAQSPEGPQRVPNVSPEGPQRVPIEEECTKTEKNVNKGEKEPLAYHSEEYLNAWNSFKSHFHEKVGMPLGPTQADAIQMTLMAICNERKAIADLRFSILKGAKTLKDSSNDFDSKEEPLRVGKCYPITGPPQRTKMPAFPGKKPSASIAAIRKELEAMPVKPDPERNGKHE